MDFERRQRLQKFIDENTDVCAAALELEKILEARGLDILVALRNVLTILHKGGTQEQAQRYAEDYGQGKAKPLEAYL